MKTTIRSRNLFPIHQPGIFSILLIEPTVIHPAQGGILDFTTIWAALVGSNPEALITSGLVMPESTAFNVELCN